MENDFEAVLKRIAARDANISKARAARLLGLSPSYFERAFKKKAGVCFRAKRFQIKMETAASLLLLTDRIVEQIAIDLEYSDRFSFEKAFKRSYSVTPTQFRVLNFPEE
jgi:AraC-like DNA-binding protein